MAIKTYLFLKNSGRCPFEDYLCPINSKREVAYIHATIDKLIQHNGQLPPPYAKKVKDKIWELRSPLGNRIFYFVDTGSEIIILDGYTKKTNRIAPRILKRVMNMYREYLITKHRKPY